jgi:lysophospholipase L1-like esterase
MQNFLAKLRAAEPVTTVVVGDSNSVVSHNTQGRANWVGLLQEALWARYGDDVVTMVNASVCGYKYRQLAADLDRRVFRWKPDLVIIALGMNDAAAGPADLPAWQDCVRDVVRRIRGESGDGILLCTSNPVVLDFNGPLPPEAEPGTPWEQGERSTGDYAWALVELAAELDCTVCDHYSAWKNRPNHFFHPAANPQGLRLRMTDAIHPNAIGHMAFFRELAPLFDVPRHFPWE